MCGFVRICAALCARCAACFFLIFFVKPRKTLNSWFEQSWNELDNVKSHKRYRSILITCDLPLDTSKARLGDWYPPGPKMFHQMSNKILVDIASYCFAAKRRCNGSHHKKYVWFQAILLESSPGHPEFTLIGFGVLTNKFPRYMHVTVLQCLEFIK